MMAIISTFFTMLILSFLLLYFVINIDGSKDNFTYSLSLASSSAAVITVVYVVYTKYIYSKSKTE